MTWLVLGGSGFVGSAVLQVLAAAGIPALSAPAPRLTTDADAPGALAAAVDAATVGNLQTVLAGHDVVVNAAGLAAPSAPGGDDLLGANALLPVVVAAAAAAAGVRRVVHLSSAAVQGRTPVLDETAATRPFSAYSRSKALGEQALALAAPALPGTSIVTVRATSVQGADRPTTRALVRLARSPIASVAAPGDARTPVTSVQALAELVVAVGRQDGPVPGIVLQPWEGMTVRSVLEAAGGRPRLLPAALCRAAVAGGYGVSALLRGRLDGQVRRAELMWFGQDQVTGWAEQAGLLSSDHVRQVLADASGAAGIGRDGDARGVSGDGPGRPPLR